MANLPLAFAEILAGGVLLTAGITGDSIGDVMKGQITRQPLQGSVGTSSSTGSSSPQVSPTGGPGTSSTPAAAPQAGKTGPGEFAFAKGFLATIGAPLTRTNVSALEDWWAAEEGNAVLVPGHGGLNNPFEVTTSGTANVPDIGNANSVGVKNYATPALGINAAIGYFDTYGSGVLQAFRSGASISQIEQSVRDLGPNAFGSDTASPWGLR